MQIANLLRSEAPACLLALVLAGAGPGAVVAQQPAPEASQAQAAAEHSAVVQYPLAVAAAADGTVYVADRNLPGIWRLSSAQSELEPYFVGSRKFRTPLNAVRCLAVDAQGRLYAGDSSTRQVYRFDDQGQPQPMTPQSADNLGPFGVPMGLAVNSKGELFVADREFRCIWRVPSDGAEPVKFVDVPAPGGLCIDQQDRVWVVSIVDDPLLRFSAEGQKEIIVTGRPFEFPHNVALDQAGAAYVTDGFHRAVWKVVEGAEPKEWLKHSDFANPVDIKAAGDELLVVDPRAKALFRVKLDATAEVVPLKP